MGLYSNVTGVFKEEKGHRDRHAGKTPCEDRGGDRSHAATHQGTPQTARKPAERSWEEAQNSLPPGFRGSMVLPTPSLVCDL